MLGIGKIISSAVVFSILLTGCGPRFDWAGTWMGMRDLPPDANNPAPILHTLSRVNLEMRINGTFSLIEGGVPREGEWSATGTEATLIIKRVMDRPVDRIGSGAERLTQPIKLKAEDHDSINYDNPASIDGKDVLLKREPQRPPPNVRNR